MGNYLLLARSITHAQQMLSALGKGGIPAKVRRAGGDLTQRGCGYSIVIAERNFSPAMERLRAAGQKPVKVFHLQGEDRFEVQL